MSNNLLTQLYYDPEEGFQSAINLRKQYNINKPKDEKNITLKTVKDWLSKQEVNQRGKKTKKSQLQSYIAPGPLFQFQVDLIVLKKANNGKLHYFLTCVDVFSKKADVQYIGIDGKIPKAYPKSGKHVSQAMRKIIKNLGVPKTIFSDMGSEFIDSNFQDLMNEYKIEHRTTQLHSPFIESFHRTLKMKLFKYLDSIGGNGIKDILNALPKILKNYNNTEHTTTKVKPNNVNKSNENEVMNNIISRSNQQVRQPVTIGDNVRIRKKDKSFEKAHVPVWSKEIFEVIDIQSPYYLVDGKNEYNEIKKGKNKFLRAHIQKVSGDIQINPSKKKIKQNLQQMTSADQYKKVNKQTEQAIEDRIKAIKSRRNRKKTVKMIAYEEDNAFEKKQKFYMNRRNR
jgi:hypothetical protein